jgi:hypothetical protein
VTDQAPGDEPVLPPTEDWPALNDYLPAEGPRSRLRIELTHHANHAKTEGNPLFMVDRLRCLHDFPDGFDTRDLREAKPLLDATSV